MNNNRTSQPSNTKTPLTVDGAYAQAMDHFNAGRFSEVDKLCTAIIQAVPNHIDAINLLGVVAQRVNSHDMAVELFQRAINIDNSRAFLYYNLGNSLKNQGKLEEGVSCYKKAIAIQPDYAEAYYNLGNTLQNQGNLSEAVSSYQKVIAIKPDLAIAYHKLGNVLKSQGKLTEAESSYKKAIAIQPDLAQAYSNLGNTLKDQGKFEEAVSSYKKAIAIQPDLVEAYSNLGDALKGQGKLEEGVSCYKKAISIKPDLAEVYSNLGNALEDQGKLEEAVSSYKKAISIKPDLAEAYYNLGNALEYQGKAEEAVSCFKKAISIKPGYADAYSNLGNVFDGQGKLEEAVLSYKKAISIKPDLVEAYYNLGNPLKNQGKLEEAVSSYKKAISIKPDLVEAYSNLGNIQKNQGNLVEAISSFKKAISIKPELTEVYSNLLFCMNYGNYTGKSLFNEHKIWNKHQAKYLQTFICKHDKGVDSGKKLRIGFVSGDFRKHCVSHFLNPLFKEYNRERLTFYCYSNSNEKDEVTTYQQKMVDEWRNIVEQEDQVVVEMIQKDQIDILVDLSGHTKGNRLVVFASKPAPVQVTWLGYPNTTGLTTIDYRFTHHIADPPGLSDQLHSEKLFRLADGFLCYQPPDIAPDITELPLKRNGYITFGSLNNLAKTTPEVIKVWSQILKAVPGSKLLLKSKALTCPVVLDKYLSLFLKESIDSDRLITLQYSPTTQAHLSKYGKIDISLDTFPYNGTTTTCESLWMGVPTVVLRGERHASCVGASIINQVGLDNLITDSVDDYIKTAISLAKDKSKLESLRAGMRNRMKNSYLCDNKGFSVNMEKAFRSMWIEWCRGEGDNL
jgi:protein O-GlcNAc transferase